MAPVGSRESLAAAIQAGADSIYFGIENLNMRARSANTFTIEDLREIARTCDEHGMKSYLTVNTIIYDKDVELMRTIVDELCQQDWSGSASVYAIEYLECRSLEVLRAICRCSGVGARTESGTGSGDLSSDSRRTYLWTGRRADPHRNVLPRSALYGCFGQVLSVFA